MLLRSASFLALAALLAGAASACGDSAAGDPDRSAPRSDPTTLAEPPAAEAAMPITLEPMLAQVDTGATDPGAGGQTGDDNGDTALDCVPVWSSALDLDERSPLGFVPRQTAAFALGPKHLSLLWLPWPIDGASPSLPEQEIELQLDIELQADHAEIIHRVEATGSGECRDVIEVAVSVEIETGDGVLREHLDGTLELQGDYAAFSISAPAATLASSVLSGARGNSSGLAASELTLAGAFTRYGGQGSLIASYGEGAASLVRQLADWPAWNSEGIGMCILGVAVLNEDLRPSVADVLGGVPDGSPIRLVDGTGTESQGTLRVTPLERTACFSPSWSYWSPEGVVDLLSVEVELELDASPTAIRLPARLRGEFARETGAMNVTLDLGLRCSGPVLLSPADFVRECGDWGVDLTGFDAADLSVSYSNLGVGPDWGAVLTVQGYRTPGCVPGPMGLACSGDGPPQIDRVSLATVRFTH